MVENPASAVGADISARAEEEDASTNRLIRLATKGAKDPAALKPDEIKDICAAFLKGTSHENG